MNATRFQQPPLPQPSYQFSEVPRPERNLEGSVLQFVEDREQIQTCLGEMLLLCKEAVRRRKASALGGSKPLSLEYLADRVDVDDPLWGYLIRSDAGMLQGFVTVTTFTNYQQSFRWDSREAAFAHDERERETERWSGQQVWDHDGTLARDLNNTVRAGDVWNEGIVWPRLAEVSLLGSLGCGKVRGGGDDELDYRRIGSTILGRACFSSCSQTLLSLVIERLEGLKATGKFNYDYLVLQATDNSVKFYESMGFVRVGAVIKANPQPPNEQVVTSRCKQYTTQGVETINDIAKKLDVDAWDVVFLNKHLFPDLTQSSRLIPGTLLSIPEMEEPKPRTGSRSSPRKRADEKPKWYTAKENDTPRTISKMFNLDCGALVEANRVRLPELLYNSRLRSGTQIKISHFDEDQFQPYAHWTFPDDGFEDGEPSYMMARRLERRKGKLAKSAPFAESLAVVETPFERSELLVDPTEPDEVKEMESKMKELVPPKQAMDSFELFASHQRDARSKEFRRLSETEVSCRISILWKALSEEKRVRYEGIARHGLTKYKREKAEYDAAVAKLGDVPMDAAGRRKKGCVIDLFNKVVRLKPGAMTEGIDFKYWYVLTFIPDLNWCHLAPMREAGTFGDDKGNSQGRTKWMLVDEKLGMEVDISGSFCIPIKAKSMRKTNDADKEEWDIIDDGTGLASIKYIDPAKRFEQSTNRDKSSIAEEDDASSYSPEKAQLRAVSRRATSTDPLQDLDSFVDEPPKRRRGRPPKRDLSSPADDPKPRRGRPPKHPKHRGGQRKRQEVSESEDESFSMEVDSPEDNTSRSRSSKQRKSAASEKKPGRSSRSSREEVLSPSRPRRKSAPADMAVSPPMTPSRPRRGRAHSSLVSESSIDSVADASPRRTTRKTPPRSKKPPIEAPSSSSENTPPRSTRKFTRKQSPTPKKKSQRSSGQPLQENGNRRKRRHEETEDEIDDLASPRRSSRKRQRVANGAFAGRRSPRVSRR